MSVDESLNQDDETRFFLNLFFFFNLYSEFIFFYLNLNLFFFFFFNLFCNFFESILTMRASQIWQIIETIGSILANLNLFFFCQTRYKNSESV